MAKNKKISPKRAARIAARNAELHNNQPQGDLKALREKLEQAINDGHGEQIISKMYGAPNLTKLHRLASGHDHISQASEMEIQTALSTLNCE